MLPLTDEKSRRTYIRVVLSPVRFFLTRGDGTGRDGTALGVEARGHRVSFHEGGRGRHSGAEKECARADNRPTTGGPRQPNRDDHFSQKMEVDPVCCDPRLL